MNNLIATAVIILLMCSCHDGGRPVLRDRLPQDSLDYLCTRADLVALVDVTNGVDSIEGKRPSGPMPNLVQGRVNRVLKGQTREGDEIRISSSPAILPPGTLQIYMTLYNGMTLAFLKYENGLYMPVSDYSLLNAGGGTVSPIWRREPGREVRYQSVSFDTALKDVVYALEEMGNTEQGVPGYRRQGAPQPDP